MNILIIADEPLLCRLLKEQLNTYGHDVTICPDAETALHAYQETFYPLIVLDTTLLELESGAFCRHIRTLPKGDRSLILALAGSEQKVGLLPGHKALLDERLQVLLLDVTEQPIERPTTHQRQYSSGKKKRHTIKAQLIVCLKTLQILLIVCGKGRTHDFTLLKQSRLRIAKTLKTYADSGYQGILKLYPNSMTPRKKPRNRDLTAEEKQYNREPAKVRIAIEHVNRRCKIFRIVKATYRGKHKHYHTTWTVVAMLVNLRYAHNDQFQGN